MTVRVINGKQYGLWDIVEGRVRARKVAKKGRKIYKSVRITPAADKGKYYIWGSGRKYPEPEKLLYR